MFGNMFSTDIGMDLGTCNTLVYIKGKGLVINEPSVVAIEKNTKRVISVGKEAKNMLLRTPTDIVAIRPLRDGVIADIETTEKMIRHFIALGLPRRWLVKPRMVIGIPSCITEVERRAVEECAYKAGARDVKVIEESLAAAIGADIPIQEPAGNMICDIGGGTSEVSVISMSGIVVTKAIRVGGDEFDEAIAKHIRTVHNMIIGLQAAERIKIKIGSAYDTANTEGKIEKMEVGGTDAITGLPRRIEIDSLEIRDSLKDPVHSIIVTIKNTLAETPPELSADIIERGIVLTGGGALLHGLDTLISKEVGVPVFIAEEPLLCVAKGAGKYYDHMRGNIYRKNSKNSFGD